MPDGSNYRSQNSGIRELQERYFDVAPLLIPALICFVSIVIFQVFNWFDWVAVICGLMTIGGGVFGLLYALRKDKLFRSPLSTLMVLGFTFSYFIFPPIATLVEGKGLTNNLDDPVLIFINALVCLLALISAHMFYEKTPLPQIIRQAISERIYKPLGYFSAISVSQLFAMGLLGVIANIISASSGDLYTENAVGVVGKLVQGLYPLMYVPYCIVLLPLLNNALKINRRHIFMLVAYSAAIIFVSVARNSRGVLFSGIASVLIAYAYGVVAQLLPRPKIHVPTAAAILLCLAAVMGPVSDFATAMTVVRGQRTDVSALVLIDATFDQYQDKEGLKRFRIESAVKNGDWDEAYVDNLFMARLSNLKFADQSIALATSMDDGSATYLRGLEWQRVLSIFPQPVIEILGIDANKEFVTTASGGDLMLFAVTGSQYALGGFRTGSIFGSGLALFGWFYPLVICFLLVLTFALVDAQVLNVVQAKNDAPHYVAILFNPLCLTSLFTWMFYLTSAATGVESMSGLAQYLVRGWIQVPVIYAFAYGLSFILVKPLKGLWD